MYRLSLILAALLFSSPAYATGFLVVTPPDWTIDPEDANPLVRVEWWFTEGDQVISGLSSLYLQPDRIREVLVDPSWWNSNRQICMNSRSVRLGSPGGQQAAAPQCVLFDADFSLRPPLICPPTP